MTKQQILDAIDSGEVELGDAVYEQVLAKLDTMPDGEWSEQDEVAFDYFLEDLVDEYAIAAEEGKILADTLETAAQDIEYEVKKTTNKALDFFYTLAKDAKDAQDVATE